VSGLGWPACCAVEVVIAASKSKSPSGADLTTRPDMFSSLEIKRDLNGRRPAVNEGYG
jgi:hypothetical protein